MDLIKIGKYIAFKRKEQGLTQKQLAEKLNMSDKSVSKWERGICLPDVSVYLELCKILDISIHEFLAGEDIPKEKIRCNVICPGSITTDMAAGLTPDTMDMKMMGAMSAHSDLTLQPCSPLDVAKVALFLASDDAAPLTGQVVVSDYGVDL